MFFTTPGPSLRRQYSSRPMASISFENMDLATSAVDTNDRHQGPQRKDSYCIDNILFTGRNYGFSFYK